MSITKPCNDLINVEPIYIEAIKAFDDNYIWAIRSQSNNSLTLVDPGDANVCVDYIKENSLTLHSILVTHHHRDHVGGIAALLAYAKSQHWPITVYGPASENIQHIDEKLKQNEKVFLPEFNCQFNIIDLPGHTNGHIAYFYLPLDKQAINKQPISHPILFCGDTLFSGGCGRLFEGTPEQMHNSLNKLAELPDETLVYCAHEYTQANLSFALAVEPMNEDLLEYKLQVKKLRLQNKATIPSSIGLEKRINPFLRCHYESVTIAADNYKKVNTKHESTVEVFATIRHWKDGY